MSNNAQTADQSALALQDTIAAPSSLGLLGLGMSAVLLNLHSAFFPLDAMILGIGIFYCGLSQIIVGIMEWRKNNTFGATAFTSYGLFWLTLIALIVLPEAGVGTAPSDQAMSTYLTMWGLFSAVLFMGTFDLNRSLQFVFGSLMLLFFLLAAAKATDNHPVLVVAGWVGIICGLSAIYTGLAQFISELQGRTVDHLTETK